MASNFSLRRPIGTARGLPVYMTPEFQRAVFGVSTAVDLLSSSSATTLFAAYAPRTKASIRANYSSTSQRPTQARYRAATSRTVFARY